MAESEQFGRKRIRIEVDQSRGKYLGRFDYRVKCLPYCKKYGPKIGFENLEPHDLRRTYAQIGIDAGVTIQQVSRLLGHSSIQITQRYLNIELDLEQTVSDFILFD